MPNRLSSPFIANDMQRYFSVIESNQSCATATNHLGKRQQRCQHAVVMSTRVFPSLAIRLAFSSKGRCAWYTEEGWCSQASCNNQLSFTANRGGGCCLSLLALHRSESSLCTQVNPHPRDQSARIYWSLLRAPREEVVTRKFEESVRNVLSGSARPWKEEQL